MHGIFNWPIMYRLHGSKATQPKSDSSLIHLEFANHHGTLYGIGGDDDLVEDRIQSCTCVMDCLLFAILLGLSDIYIAETGLEVV